VSDLYPRLLGDIGGTNARLAWQREAHGPLEDVAVYPCAQFASLHVCVGHYLSEHGNKVPVACAMGIATQILGDWVSMPNNPWTFSIAAMKQALNLKHLLFVNDFTALAWSLPDLSADDLHCINAGQPVKRAPLALLGPGTGLGVSGLLPTPQGGYVAISGEGGHVSLSADNPHEVAVVAYLRQRFGHASNERALCGQGLVQLYEATCSIAGQPSNVLLPHEVMAQALQGSDPHCIAALQLFFAFLGSAAGNLALTLGARGGVYIGGGIVPRALQALERSQFLARFLQKGRYQAYLQPIAVHVITRSVTPALLGASRALDLQSQA
jgi:glucokinase